MVSKVSSKKWLLFPIPLLVILISWWSKTDRSMIPRYQIVELGTLPGGMQSGAIDINNRGQVVGYSRIEDAFLVHAFVWDATSGMKDLGSELWESRINDRGQIAGRKMVPDGTTEWSHAFVWDASLGFTDLGSIIDDGNRNIGLTDEGVVYWSAPYSEKSNRLPKTFQVWSPEEGSRNIQLGENSIIRLSDMNERGASVGMLEDATSAYHGFLHTEKGGVEILSSSQFTGRSIEPILINDSGSVVGVVYGGWNDQLFIWDRKVFRYLDLPNGGFVEPRGWNGQGQLIGVSTNRFQDLVSAFQSSLFRLGEIGFLIEDMLFPPSHEPEEFWPFLWENGVTTDLRDLIAAETGWADLSPQAINDPGQIVGSGILEGRTRAFLMNPIEPDEK